MQLTVWTYEGPPHVGAMRIATAMEGVHYVLHAPQGDTYADLLFTMIERRGKRPPVTYTTFQARDLGKDTAELFQTAARDAYARFQPAGDAGRRVVHRRADPGRSRRPGRGDAACPARSSRSNCRATSARRIGARRRPSTSWSARSPTRTRGPPPRDGRRPRANLLGPTALGFRHRDDVIEITRLLDTLGIDVNVVAPLGAIARRSRAARRRPISTSASIPRSPTPTCRWLERRSGRRPSAPCRSATPRRATSSPRSRRSPASIRRAALDTSNLPWWSRSVDSTYLTGKRVFIFGDATHAIAAARVARDELGFEVVGLGCYNREFARDLRDAAKLYGVEPLITDDYLEVEDAIQALQPELVLGTQMERHIAKRLRIPCAVISAPVHVQDFPARYSPQMGFEGANVLFDTWVHPLVMGLEEHLLTMFRDDFEFSDASGASHLGHGFAPLPLRRAAPGEGRAADPSVAAHQPRLTRSRERERAAGPPTPSANCSRSRSSCAARRGATPRSSPPSTGSPRSRSTRSTTRRRIMPGSAAPLHVVIVTLDNHLSGAAERAAARFARRRRGHHHRLPRRRRLGPRRRRARRAASPISRAATSSSRRCCSSTITSAPSCPRSRPGARIARRCSG